RRRPAVVAALLGGFLAAAGLCIASYRADARSPGFQRAEATARMRAQKALRLARENGVPPEGALALLQNQPDERGARLFSRACTDCHAQGAKAPKLEGFLSRRWIRETLIHPEQVYATSKLSGMEGYGKLGEEKISRLVDYL